MTGLLIAAGIGLYLLIARKADNMGVGFFTLLWGIVLVGGWVWAIAQ